MKYKSPSCRVYASAAAGKKAHDERVKVLWRQLSAARSPLLRLPLAGRRCLPSRFGLANFTAPSRIGCDREGEKNADNEGLTENLQRARTVTNKEPCNTRRDVCMHYSLSIPSAREFRSSCPPREEGPLSTSAPEIYLGFV